jgi:serine protease Do
MTSLRKTFFASVGALSGLAGIALLAGGVAPPIGLNTARAEPASVVVAADAAVAPLTKAEQQSVGHAKSLSHAFRTASSRVLPSVVMIRTESKRAQPVSESGVGDQQIPEELRNNPIFKRFFENVPQRPNSPRGESGAPRSSGMGSGVIIDESGMIMTNNHVVDGAGKVVVRLHDGREFEATEWKTDPKTDIAIVRIEGAGTLQAAELGNSDALEVGDWVIAVGAPFGLKETVTAGIISAKSRGIGITDREEFLQTDAAINPGNSGGPLVNLNGEVIGINTAISSRSGGYDGIGFAVPISLARWVTDQLASTGNVQRAFLGVGIQAVTSDLSKQFGLSSVEGAVVTDIRPDSPAVKSGLKAGDVIVSFGGQRIGEPRDLQNVVERSAIGQDHTIVVYRDGKRLELNVRVNAMPEHLTVSSGGGKGDAMNSEFSSLGLDVDTLTADVSKQLGMGDIKGVVVTRVLPDSPAERAGLEDGMVITRVLNKSVASLNDFRAAVKEYDVAKGILLLVHTSEGSRFVVLK